MLPEPRENCALLRKVRKQTASGGVMHAKK